jgi:hypothetical protein
MTNNRLLIALWYQPTKSPLTPTLPSQAKHYPQVGKWLIQKFLVAQVFNLCEGVPHSLERLCHQAEKLMGEKKPSQGRWGFRCYRFQTALLPANTKLPSNK